jgi:glyoxylase-like metal-dependent hydrolase (beta-lactamase superfamily II)
MIATQKFEEVLQIKLCRFTEFIPAATVSAYLVDGLLIDSGPAHTAEELAEFFRDKKVNTIVNTHFHEDHIAANRFLQERYGIEIFAPPLSVDKINKPAGLYPYQEEVWGYPIPSQVKPLGKTIARKSSHWKSSRLQDMTATMSVCLSVKKAGSSPGTFMSA